MLYGNFKSLPPIGEETKESSVAGEVASSRVRNGREEGIQLSNPCQSTGKLFRLVESLKKFHYLA
jgi:hypothetical protein